MHRKLEQNNDEVVNIGIQNNTTISDAYLEPRIGNALLGAQKIARLDQKCRLHIHSQRYRLTDADGVCGKYVIDALIHAGLLRDDSPKEVEEVTYSQEKIPKTEKEQTIVKIIWDVGDYSNDVESNSL